MASYTNTWNSRAQMYSEMEWVPLRKMKLLLNHLDGCKIAIQSSRIAALDFMSKIDKDSPFERTRRFPEYDTWIALDQGDWPNKFRQIMSALNYKDTAQAIQGKGFGTKPTDPSKEEQFNQVPNDVLLSFTTGIQSIRNQIGRREYLFTRDILENELSIVWG